VADVRSTHTMSHGGPETSCTLRHEKGSSSAVGRTSLQAHRHNQPTAVGCLANYWPQHAAGNNTTDHGHYAQGCTRLRITLTCWWYQSPQRTTGSDWATAGPVLGHTHTPTQKKTPPAVRSVRVSIARSNVQIKINSSSSAWGLGARPHRRWRACE
jgi:hypothetical protein